MPTEAETPPTHAPEIKAETAPRDLRAELQANLEAEFIENLKAAETLPDAVRESLAVLLASRETTSADVIAALSLGDPIKPEVSGD